MTTFVSSRLFPALAERGDRMQHAAIGLAVQHDESLPVLPGIGVQGFIEHVR